MHKNTKKISVRLRPQKCQNALSISGLTGTTLLFLCHGFCAAIAARNHGDRMSPDIAEEAPPAVKKPARKTSVESSGGVKRTSGAGAGTSKAGTDKTSRGSADLP